MSAETSETFVKIGDRLRGARVAAGLDIDQISADLKIQKSYIHAIESLDMETLPSAGYALGYVRAYANYLGLDGKAAVDAYKTQTAIPENLRMRDQPHFVPKRHVRVPRGFFAASVVMSCALVLAFWYGSQTDAQSAALSTSPISVAETQIAVAAKIDPNILTVKAIAPSWVEIKDKSGQTVVSRIFVTGESWQTEKSSGVTITARDSGALELYAGSDLLGLMGQQGQPILDRPLLPKAE